jgi:hypothetical protein
LDRGDWETLAGNGEDKYFTMQSGTVSNVTDLYRALAQIDSIRGQMARGTEFRGYGPATVAATGALAMVAAAVQSHSLQSPGRHIGAYLAIWIVTAALAVIIVSVETITRTRRVHSGLAREMMHSAVEQLLPAILAGFLLTVVLVRSASPSVWMLPGLWQVIYSLGIFSSCKFVPRQMYAIGLWYLTTGLIYLATGGGGWAFSPWAMGVPFGIGQVLVAAVLQFDYQEADEQA